MDEFVARENVQRFETLLARAESEEERARLKPLLDEARARLEQVQRAKWTAEARRAPNLPGRGAG